jgi:hypothetical protein
MVSSNRRYEKEMDAAFFEDKSERFIGNASSARYYRFVLSTWGLRPALSALKKRIFVPDRDTAGFFIGKKTQKEEKK